MRLHIVLVLAALLSTTSCATLGQLARVIQPLRFSEVPGQQSTIRLAGPSLRQPLGGAAVRLWTRVSNPNPIGVTLSTLRAEVSFDGTRAATGDFPLGLPLAAGGESDVPLDLSIDFADLPGLSDVLRRTMATRQVPYEVHGSFSIEAGALGRPSFGPLRLFEGRLGRQQHHALQPPGSRGTGGALRALAIARLPSCTLGVARSAEMRADGAATLTDASGTRPAPPS